MSKTPPLSQKPGFRRADDPNVQLVATAVARGLDDKGLRIMDTMKKVKSVYVPTRNDKLADVPFERIKRAASGLDPECFAVTLFAEAGVGKSALIEQRLKDEISFQPVPDGYGNFLYPVLYVKAPSKASTTDLGEQMLDDMGYPISRTKKESAIVRDVGNHLRRRGTRVVIIDEFQHVLDAPKMKGPSHVADSIKNLLQNPRWPIMIVLVGLPEIKEVVLRDPKDQMLRRVDDFGLLELSLDQDGEMIAGIVIELVEKRAGLRMSPDVIPDFIERLMFGAHFRFGMVMKTIYHTIEDALEHDETVVSAHNWEEGYRRLVNGDYDLATNVMASDEWRTISRPINRQGKFGPSSRKSKK
ncbi:hypothetical protein RRU01S_39_00140 [Agrobacterium rubi TR3 = NBRC 13261]|uniref:AAA+ ATPase domain-containing protein n=1 Tax=Agrobacterium rubi TR3 = NBRC 13261 TaxID=1368415 RepID=A0A081D3D8_9HYPH|nr:TniB family NTP-binding protein [Agrobacterium rubi]MBP1881624.1 hypothetical protein [Agrobacterium rubi]GAK73434.1 hypothetical protein RRU01S_39_00140 [Agrobacterium rubi TR3 = NBRC 13261]